MDGASIVFLYAWRAIAFSVGLIYLTGWTVMTYQKQIGNLGEMLAEKFLEEHGYQILDRNFTTRYGEIDLVAVEAETENVIFVEVKTRTTNTYGEPEDSITPAKMERLQNAALLWLQAHPDATDDWRIDVISIQLDRQQSIRDIQHFINVS